MAVIILTCPYCNKERMTFDIVAQTVYSDGSYGSIRSHTVAVFCRSCRNGATLRLAFNAQQLMRIGLDHQSVWTYGGDVTSIFVVKDIWPKPDKPSAPMYLPSAVESAFLEAEDSRLRGNRASAGAMYRKALDVATKRLDPSITDLNLAPRLRRLAQAQRLTPDIADWADRIRLLGNSAAHDDETPGEADIADLANLSRMALIYLFEMPEHIRIMREPKNQ